MSTELVEIIFMWTPINGPMFHRPMESQLTPESLNRLDSQTQGGVLTGTEALSSVAGSILRPSTQANGLVEMPYGWDQGRFAVMARFETHGPIETSVDILTGYTSYDGISRDEAADPDMQIFFNSHSKARPFSQMMQGRRMNTLKAESNVQLLRPIDVRDPRSPQHHQAKTMLRPVDTLAHLHRNNMHIPGMVDGVSLTDSRSNINTPYVSARRTTAMPSHYLSNLMAAHRAASANNHEQISSDFGNGATASLAGYMSCNELINEDDGGRSALINKLINNTGFRSCMPVTVREIQELWPQFADTTKVRHVVRPTNKSVISRTDTESWGVTGLEGTIAYSMCHVVPAIASNLLMSMVSFNITNRTVGLSNPHKLSLSGANWLADMYDTPLRLARAEDGLRAEICGQLAGLGVTDYYIEVAYNMCSTLEIKLSVNGGPLVEFSAPAYCDAIYTPLLSMNEQSLSNLSNDVASVLDHVYGAENHTIRY